MDNRGATVRERTWVMPVVKMYLSCRRPEVPGSWEEGLRGHLNAVSHSCNIKFLKKAGFACDRVLVSNFWLKYLKECNIAW